MKVCFPQRIGTRLLAVGSILSVLLLSGCASPRYVPQTSYIPPQGTQAQMCIQGCQTKLQACQADCTARRNACVAKIEPQVDQAFQEALKRYEIQRQQYEADRQSWMMDRQFDWAVGYGWPYPYHRHYYSSFWLTDRPYYNQPPVPPPAPSKQAIRAQMIQEHCNVPCDCQHQFDQCYVGCGGTVQHRMVCVENCGPNDPRPSDQSAKPAAKSSAGETTTQPSP